MPTTFSDIGDIEKFFLEDFQSKTWDDIARTRQNNFVAQELFKKRRKSVPASEKITWNLKAYSTNNTVADSLMSEDSLNRNDLGIKAEAKWHLQKTHMMWDRREPVFRSNSATQILDYMDMQATDMLDDFYDQNETWCWTLPTAPNDGSAGDILPNGIPYYITDPTTEAFGFTGGNPTDYSTCANVDSDVHAGWKNGGFKYSEMTDANFGQRLDESMDKCNFDSPRPGSDNENVPALDYGLYSSYKPFKDYKALLFASNDNTGKDAGKWRGGVPGYGMSYQYYRGVAWCWVAALSEVGGLARDLSEPIYGINWSTFDVLDQDGLFMERTSPIALDSSHNTRVVHMDTIYQIRCRNRRLNFKGIAVNDSSE